tara:strand:- start:25147 stop:25725 length:579 start_codon:yes stop_codon:yes gene_type:complete
MPSTDYSNALIYEIKCKNPLVKFFEIGGTTNLKNIKYRYRKAYMDGIHSDLNHQITANGGFDNWQIVVLEQYDDCSSKDELNKRVDKWIKYRMNSQKNLVFIHQNPPTLVDHPPEINAIHPPEGKKNECVHCKKPFTRIDSLKRHLRGRCSQKNDSYNKLRKDYDALQERCKHLENIISQIKETLKHENCVI